MGAGRVHYAGGYHLGDGCGAHLRSGDATRTGRHRVEQGERVEEVDDEAQEEGEEIRFSHRFSESESGAISCRKTLQAQPRSPQ